MHLQDQWNATGGDRDDKRGTKAQLVLATNVWVVCVNSFAFLLKLDVEMLFSIFQSKEIHGVKAFLDYPFSWRQFMT